MFSKPSGKPDFFNLEEEVSKWWKENKTFEKSIENREGATDYIFYDGPPFMSGIPHYATLLSSLAKDVVPRYQTMIGKKVERVWGWDTHGLPIENKVEKELNIKSRKEIEERLEEFVKKCYEWNRVGIENWRWYIDHIGRWADLDNAYRTLDQDFMESVWWTYKSIQDKGLIYKGKRTSLFSTDSSTPVSNFEVSMDPDNYQDTEDIAVTVKFKLTEDSRGKIASKVGNENPVFLLAWTTTPWTLPSNFALAVNPESDYVVVTLNNENYILNEKRLAQIEEFKEQYSVGAKLSPKELEGLSYEQLFPFLTGAENDFKVYLSNFVTTEDGTGVLHVAPAFGEEDFEMGKEFKLSDKSDINDDGLLEVGPWKGTYLRDANPLITKDLETSGKLFKQEKYVHKLPFYRYKNPLIYKTQESYFVNVQKLKEQLVKSNESINWVPEYFKEGRFKYILETAPDWSISRSRFWGTVMPVWRNEDGEEIVIGARDELMDYVNNSNTTDKIRKVILELNPGDDKTFENYEAEINNFKASKELILVVKTTQENISQIRNKFFGETVEEANVKPLKESEKRLYYFFNDAYLDLHRPYIDKVTFVFNNKTYTRIKETLDVWMDSGSMPFAQFHYPFVNKEKFEQSFPGDFIAEYTGQIRAWFYVLHVISNALFNQPSFKNVLVTGVLAGTDGRKMSKSYGNYPDPKATIQKYGGEALRLYFLSSTLMNGNDMNFNEADLRMQVQEILLPLWNIYSYVITYANIHNWVPNEELAYNKRDVTADEHPWDHIPFDDVETELDAWILLRLQETIKESTDALDKYEIPRAIRPIKELIDDLSKWYIRRSRDRFAEGDSTAMETIYYVFIEILKLLAPFTPFISEYMYRELAASVLKDVPESVHLTDYPKHDQRFIDEYQKLKPEMEFVRKIAEMGNNLRVENQLKVRQPLAKLEIVNTNQTTPVVADWMQRILESELNVQEVMEKAALTKSETVVSIEDTTLGVNIGLETAMTEELKQEGFVRELVRNIQSARKKQGLKQGELISLELEAEEAVQSVINSKLEDIKKAVTAQQFILKNGLEGESIEEFVINNDRIKMKIIK